MQVPREVKTKGDKKTTKNHRPDKTRQHSRTRSSLYNNYNQKDTPRLGQNKMRKERTKTKTKTRPKTRNKRLQETEDDRDGGQETRGNRKGKG